MYESLSDLVITGVTAASTMFNPTGRRGETQNRPTAALVYRYEGETVYECGGREILSRHDCLVFLPQGAQYRWICRETGHFILIEFTCECNEKSILRFPIRRGDKIRAMMRELEYTRIAKPPLFELRSRAQLYDIFCTVFSDPDSAYLPTAKQEKLRPAIEYIAKYYYLPIRNEELAEKAGMSTVYFRKLFTDHYGMPPIRYIQNIRIEKAKDILKSDYGSIADVADAVGYANIYHFSRAFKNVTGLSPARFARLQK